MGKEIKGKRVTVFGKNNKIKAYPNVERLDFDIIRGAWLISYNDVSDIYANNNLYVSNNSLVEIAILDKNIKQILVDGME